MINSEYTVLRSNFLLRSSTGGSLPLHDMLGNPGNVGVSFDPTSKITDSHILENLLIKSIEAVYTDDGSESNPIP